MYLIVHVLALKWTFGKCVYKLFAGTFINVCLSRSNNMCIYICIYIEVSAYIRVNSGIFEGIFSSIFINYLFKRKKLLFWALDANI